MRDRTPCTSSPFRDFIVGLAAAAGVIAAVLLAAGWHPSLRFPLAGVAGFGLARAAGSLLCRRARAAAGAQPPGA